MDNLRESVAELTHDIVELKHTVHELAGTVNELTGTVNELTGGVAGLSGSVKAITVEMRDGFNNLIIANEVTRDLASQAAKLAINVSHRLTRLEQGGTADG
ncbi:MAG TPA: hypothetical protein VLZ81_01040 [Blastocatellia bacterium]|nr:hypothetical protein [Blastocatellia bacterium]